MRVIRITVSNRNPVVKHPFIYLASQSPRRAELLAQMGIEHQLLLADETEDAEGLEAIRGAEAPAVYVPRVTHLKLLAAVARAQKRGLWANEAAGRADVTKTPVPPILCADTTVALGRTIYAKPTDANDAARMLADLSGRTHRVLSAVGVAWRSSGQGAGQIETALRLSESKVTFASLTPHEIAAYVATGEPFGKAGSYGVQGKAAAFISKISGSYSGIMGLPLFDTAQLLRGAGLQGLG
jgi:septum formation protein